MSSAPTYVPLRLGYAPGSRAELFNVLVVVVDDLRADRLPMYGHSVATSPHLERRLETATVFKNCHSPVGWTLPACASIVTGQDPDAHGLVDHNRRFLRPKLGDYLGDDYTRVGITNNGNVVSDNISVETLESLGLKRRPAKWRFFGWDAGFDHYHWSPREQYERPFDLAQEFLASCREEQPWFLFFHTNVVHDYHMDRKFYVEVEDLIGRPLHPSLRRIEDGPKIWRERPSNLTLEQIQEELSAKYDGGIRYADQRIEELLALVDFEQTIVVFMSDHGEGFAPEEGRVHHCGRLHNDLTHVPLILWLPERLRSRYDVPREETRFCSTLDVAPSILTLLGDAVAEFPGQFLLDLPEHRRLTGIDRGYVYWNEDCVRESYDTCRIEIRSELAYPLKQITVQKNDAIKEFSYNLAYDPGERQNLRAVLPTRPTNFEPISFVVAVNDQEELNHNLLSSPVAHSSRHEWLLIENAGNQRYDSISRLCDEACEQARHDLVFFVHQDLFLPEGWEARTFDALAELERIDPHWGVLGAVGALPLISGQTKELRGHWSDPSGYHRHGPLPHEVQSLDEQWLGVRKTTGIRFDRKLPGFHCYGMDLSLTAREKGLKSYAIDSFVWHKFLDSDGHLVESRQQSAKIRRRWSDEFMAEFQPAANYVEEKWKKYLPFQTTSWNWGGA
jgi:arylsulfatase A-like enzyme